MVMGKVDSSLVTSISLNVNLKGPPAFDVLNTDSHLHPWGGVCSFFGYPPN